MTKKHIQTKQREKLIIDFSFHNVGQGLFYSGKIGDFNFIYDCGSLRRDHLDSVVQTYIRHKLADSKVDLLILSHLHDDHISGLDSLFKNGVSIDVAILPYLPPIERLMVSLGKRDLSSWFYEFWADPVKFLIEERKVKKIILLGGREGHPPEELPSGEESFETKEEKLDLSEMTEDPDLRTEVKKESQLQEYLDRKQLLTMSHRGPLKAVGIWFFRFFNYKVEDSKQESFEDCVNAIVKDGDLIAAIKNKSQRDQLRKKCYPILGGEFNNTSLVVYHAPIIPDRFETLGLVYNDCCEYPPFFCSFCFPNRFGFHDRGSIGHFLTGDINLNEKWIDIQRHYDPYFPKVAVVLVPHHGSRHNWNRSLLEKIDNPSLWVTSAGISNVYHHPNFEVIEDIIRKGNNPYFGNELNGISIRIIEKPN